MLNFLIDLLVEIASALCFWKKDNPGRRAKRRKDRKAGKDGPAAAGAADRTEDMD